MTLRVGINGFGRIGRSVFRILAERPDIDVVCINDLFDNEQLAYLLKYDTVMRIFPREVRSDADFMYVDGIKTHMTAERDPAAIPWSRLGVDYVIESTGVFTSRDKLAKHLTAGAKKVILTVPPKDDIDAMIVMGVNDHTLKSEHRLIEQVLNALERQLEQLGVGKFDAEFFEQALDFFANFADGCHHYKEEVALFPSMERRGMPRESGPIGVMLQEHDWGRACLAGIRQNLEGARAGSSQSMEAIREHAGDYIDLLRQHISKEDNVLFRMAEQVLPPEEVEVLWKEFHNEDNPRVASGVRKRYEEVAEALKARSLAVAAP